MAVISYCDLCGSVICRNETGTAHWKYNNPDGSAEFVQMCGECIEKVSDYIRSLEEDFSEYNAPRYGAVIGEEVDNQRTTSQTVTCVYWRAPSNGGPFCIRRSDIQTKNLKEKNNGQKQE